MNPDELFDEERFRPTPGDALPAANLTELLSQAATNRAYEPELYRRLLSDSLAILVREWPQGWQPGSQEEIPLTPLFLQSGEFPVFTSREALFANPSLDPENTPYAFINGRELLTGMQQHPVIVDAFSKMNMLLPPEFIGQLLAGEYAHHALAGQVDALHGGQAAGLRAVPPAQAPLAEQLGQQLALLFRQHPRVQLAYLMWQEQVEGLDEPCFVVFAEVEGANEQLGQEIAYVASQLLNEARLNLRIYFNPDPEPLRDLAGQLGIVPFYQN